MGLNANITTLAKKSKLQHGAWIALNNKELWTEILSKYTELLKESVYDEESISESFNKTIQGAKDSFWKNLQHEWLYGDRSSRGVVSEISKYFTESDESGSYDQKNDIFTFEYNLIDQKEEWKNNCNDRWSIKAFKKDLLDKIKSSSESVRSKNKIEREKRQNERIAQQKRKEEYTKWNEEKRKSKLLALKA